MSVPRLRFPGFVREWEEKRLGQLSSVVSGLTYSPSDIREKGLLVLRSSNIKDSEIVLDDCVFVDPQIKGANLSQPGDILICVRNGSSRLIGKNAVLPQGMPLATHGAFMTVLRAKDTAFISQLLKTDDYQSQVAADLGARINSINSGQLKKYRFYVPTLPEQKKIAAFLGVVDAKIAALRARVLGLQTYKRGLMQALFSQSLRFTKPDGTAFPDWEEKRLGKILFERREMETKGEGLPHISLTTEGVVPKTARYDRDFLVGDDEVKKYKVTRLGDLCYNPANLKFGVISINHLGDGIFSPIYVTFEIRGVDHRFLENYVKQWSFQKKVRRFEQGTVYERQAVSSEDFVKALIPFPHPDEQAKIAAALQAMDAKITAAQLQVDRMQDFKKGLLQQMFV